MDSVVLAKVIASTVLAGELSLMAAQVSGDLVKAHEKLGNILFMCTCSLINGDEIQSDLFVE